MRRVHLHASDSRRRRLVAQTTIEFYTNLEARQEAHAAGTAFRNPFDEGSARKNLRRVFGAVPWYRHLLPSGHAPPEPLFAFDLQQAEDRKVARIPV